MPIDPLPRPSDQTPEAKLKRNIRQVCRRVVRGKAALGNWQVAAQRTLQIASIILSSLGSAGVIVDKVAGNLPGETGWAFWGSVILLGFSIVLQVANELRISQLAADSRVLAEQCALHETQLENMLIDENPVDSVSDLLTRLCQLFETPRYNVVLPRMTQRMEVRAETWVLTLIDSHEVNWHLVARRPRGGAKPAPPDTAPPSPPDAPEAGS